MRAVRVARGLSAEETARRARRSCSGLYRYEAGTMVPSMVTLCVLAEVLSCDVGEFFDPNRPAERHWLTATERRTLRRQVTELATMSDDQIEAIAAVVARAHRDNRERVAG